MRFGNMHRWCSPVRRHGLGSTERGVEGGVRFSSFFSFCLYAGGYVGFHPSFSRHGKVSKRSLACWLNENVSPLLLIFNVLFVLFFCMVCSGKSYVFRCKITEKKSVLWLFYPVSFLILLSFPVKCTLWMCRKCLSPSFVCLFRCWMVQLWKNVC